MRLISKIIKSYKKICIKGLTWWHESNSFRNYLKMARLVIILWILVVLVKLVNLSLQKERVYVLEHDYIFSDCEIMPPGFVTQDNFVDRSQLILKRGDAGVVNVSGNVTIVWDVQLSDRVEVGDQALYCVNNFVYIHIPVGPVLIEI